MGLEVSEGRAQLLHKSPVRGKYTPSAQEKWYVLILEIMDPDDVQHFPRLSLQKQPCYVDCLCVCVCV